MAELFCKVENCTYNGDNFCSKGDINVGGENAKREEDTCCESFREKGSGAFTGSLSHPSPTINIDCEAVKCVYNEDYKCRAEHVDIRGCGACDCKETACATFREQ